MNFETGSCVPHRQTEIDRAIETQRRGQFLSLYLQNQMLDCAIAFPAFQPAAAQGVCVCLCLGV